MKKALAVLTTVFLLSFTSNANVFFTETFSYADGSLTNVSSEVWTAHSGGGNLSVQVGSGAITLAHGSGSREDVNRLTGSTIGAGDTWYAGFDLTVSGGSTTVYFAHFLAGTSTFDARTFVTAGTSGDFTLGMGAGSAPTVTWASDLTFGETYRVVLSHDFDSAENTLWIDPVNQASTSISYTGFQDALTAFAFRQSGGDSTQLIDNLVVATTFNEAMVVPEPSTFLLGGLGLLGLLLFRRKA